MAGRASHGFRFELAPPLPGLSFLFCRRRKGRALEYIVGLFAALSLALELTTF
jgi:hypothetical protein